MNEQVDKLRIRRLLSGGIILLLLIKLFLAGWLDLYSDEAFYWLASTYPAIAYSDLPFMTALMAGAGPALDAGNTLAVRLPFIAMGSSLPLLIYWLALPVTGKRQALESAILALCIPLGGFLGLLAVPDVPLLFFGLLAIGFFERALRTDRLSCWIAAGVFVALGFCTHYRFVLYPAAAVIFLVLFKPEHKQWWNPRLWLAVGLAGIGLIPVLWFNFTQQLASASFYFVDRHPWEFQPTGLLHLFKQAGVVTPPLYLLLGLTLWQMLGRESRRDRSTFLLACFALPPLLVYLALAPWTDANSTSLHWPLAGYFPLLVFAPSALRTVYAWAGQRWHTATARRLTILIPALGFCGSLVALTAIGSQAFQLPLQRIVGTGVLSNKMAGWEAFTGHTSELLAGELAGHSPIIVTDNYYTAAQLQFAGLGDAIFTLDQDKSVRDGRITQFRLWNRGASGIVEHTGRPVLYVTEDSTLTIPDKEIVIHDMCRYVNQLDFLDSLSLFNGDKRFSFYLGEAVVDPTAPANHRAHPCPYPPRAWIDLPVAGTEMSGLFQIVGWAYNEDIGIDSVHLLLNGRRVAQIHYGIHRPDVVEVMDVTSDPNAPNLGFNHELDTHSIANGSHMLAIELIDEKGVSTLYGERKVRVNN